MSTASPIVTWPRLSALICLTRGTSVPFPAATFNYIDALAGLTTTKLRETCSANQQMSTVRGLFRRACTGATNADATRSFLTCAGAGDFAVRLRTPNPGDDTFGEFIGPNGIVLPWKLKGDSQGAVAAKFEAGGGAPAIPPVGSQMNADAVVIEPFLQAVELAASPDHPVTRAEFEKLHGNEAAMKAWLVAKGQQIDSGFQLPASLTLGVNTAVPTTDTWIGVVDGHLRLEIGWKPPVDEALAGEGMGVMIHSWPCGAFKGF